MSSAPQPVGGLDQLQSKLEEQNKAQGHVTLDGTTLSISGLDSLLQSTLGVGLPVTGVNLSLTPATLEMRGQIGFLDTAFQLDAMFTVRGPEPRKSRWRSASSPGQVLV